MKMISYKDMTFCQESECKKFKDCPRALTTQVREDAERWWGPNSAPIAVILGRLECFEKKENTAQLLHTLGH